MPRPAIRMPVCPVARKSTATLRVGRGAQHLGSARFEVRDDGIHRHAAAGDEDSRLPRGAEIDVDIARRERARERKRRIFLAERAVGPDRKEALAAPLRPGRDRDVLGRRADVDEPSAVAHRGVLQRRRFVEPRVHAADDVEPGRERIDQRRNPVVVDDAAGVRDADHEPARAACARFLRRKAREPGRDRRAARPFADDAIARPVAKAEGGLRVAGLGGVAEEQQVRLRERFDGRVPQRVACRHCVLAQKFTSKPTPIVRGISGIARTCEIEPSAALRIALAFV